MTLTGIRDQIKIDANILGDVNFPDARLDNIINQAQKFVQTELNGLGMKKWETSSTVTALTAATYAGVNVKTTPTPSDMMESPKSITQIEINDTGAGAGEAKEVDKATFHQINLNTFMQPTITQAAYMRLDNTIYLSPSGIGEVKIHYYKVVSDLVSDSDESEIPSEFIEHVIRRAVSQIEAIKGKLDESIARERELKNDIAEAYNKFIGKMQTEKTVEKLQ